MSDEYPECLCGHAYGRHPAYEQTPPGCFACKRCDGYIAGPRTKPEPDTPQDQAR